MKSFVTLLSLASILAHAEGIEAASLKVYKGSEGQLVDVMMLKPVKQGLALVRVRASGSPFDGLVLDAKVEDRSDRFTTRFHGASWMLLQVAEGSGRVYFPEVKEFSVRFNEEATGKVTAAELIAERQKQLAAGDLAMFAKKEYPHLTKKYEAKAAAAMAELAKSCPGPSTFAFQWSSFSDDDMDNLDAWALCQPLVAAVRSKCAAAKGVSKLVCRMGPKLELTRSEAALTFTTTAKGSTEGPAFVAAALGK